MVNELFMRSSAYLCFLIILISWKYIKSFLNGMWIFLLIARPFIKDNEIIDHMVDPLTPRVIYGEIMSLLICG